MRETICNVEYIQGLPEVPAVKKCRAVLTSSFLESDAGFLFVFYDIASII